MEAECLDSPFSTAIWLPLRIGGFLDSESTVSFAFSIRYNANGKAIGEGKKIDGPNWLSECRQSTKTSAH